MFNPASRSSSGDGGGGIYRDGYDLAGGLNRKNIIKTLNLDPLYGCDYPVRPLETVPLLYDNDVNLDDEGNERWKKYVLDFDEITHLGVMFGPILGLVVTSMKLAANIVVALTGVVIAPIYINSRTYFVGFNEFIEYAMFRWKFRARFSWDTVLEKADALGIPKPQIVKARQEAESKVKHEKLRHRAREYLKSRPMYERYYHKMAKIKSVTGAFGSEATFLPRSIMMTQLYKHIYNFFENHTFSQLNREYRAKYKIPNSIPLPWTTKISLIGKWFFPKLIPVKYVITSALFPYIVRNIRPHIANTPYLFGFYSFNVWLGSQFYASFGYRLRNVIPNWEGIVFGLSIISGVQMYSYFVGRTSRYLPKIKRSQIPKVVIGLMIWGYAWQMYLTSRKPKVPRDYIKIQKKIELKQNLPSWSLPDDFKVNSFKFFTDWAKNFREKRRQINEQIMNKRIPAIPEYRYEEKVHEYIVEYRKKVKINDPQFETRYKYYKSQPERIPIDVD